MVQGAMAQLDSEKIEGSEAGKARWPRTLADLYDIVLLSLMKNAQSGTHALAEKTVVALADYFGGRPIYVPTARRMRTFVKHREIHSRLGRESAETLSAEYGLSVSQIYRIHRIHRDLDRAERRKKQEGDGGQGNR